MALFEDLSDDILYLVFQHWRFDRHSILRLFRHVSKRLSAFAESVLYRTIVLQEESVIQEQASYRFIERLLDPHDALSRYVRSFHIKSFKGNDKSYCMNTKLLLACLNSIPKLHSVSWDAEVPMASDLLDALHQRHPNARLCVSLKNLDHALVSSAQLHRLSISVPCSDVVNPNSVAAFNQLKGVLIQSRSLRTLCIDVHQDPTLRKLSSITTETTRETQRVISRNHDLTLLPPVGVNQERNEKHLSNAINKIQIPLDPMDRLPSLDFLALHARTYLLDREHCTHLLECMNWTKLKRLTLGPSNPIAFFEAFTDKLPLLEHLDISYHSNLRNHYPGSIQALNACSEFVSSLGNLKVLAVRCDWVDLQDMRVQFWRNLVSTHGNRLQTLSIQARHEGLEGPMLTGHICDYIPCFINLKILDLALNTFSPAWGRACDNCSSPPHALSTHYIRNIPLVASLETIHISIRVHPCNERSLHSSIADHAQCAITMLWATYADILNEYELENFSIRFWRWENPSPHPDEDGLNRNARIDTVVFESGRRNGQLVIRACDNRKVMETRYNEVWCENDGGVLRTTYTLDQAVRQDIPR